MAIALTLNIPTHEPLKNYVLEFPVETTDRHLAGSLWL